MIHHDSTWRTTMMRHHGALWCFIRMHHHDLSWCLHDASWWCVIMIHPGASSWFMTSHHGDSSWWIMMVHHYELQCGHGRIPFRTVTALLAMGSINKCHTSIHGSHGIFPSRPQKTAKYTPPCVTCCSSWALPPLWAWEIALWWRMGVEHSMWHQGLPNFQTIYGI